MKKFKIAIIGATGYTGHELIKILHNHDALELAYLTTTSSAGKNISEIYPDLSNMDYILEEFQTAKLKSLKIDLAFVALPHGEAMNYVDLLLQGNVKVVDLSADFRFADANVYEKSYKKHMFPELCKQAVYGLPEFFRDKIKKAKLIANPGCYVTCSLLPLLPIIKYVDNIIVDAKSGVSGAGRKAEDAYMFTNINNNFKAYAIAKHRHQPEIENYLNKMIEFTPHLLPISRGILSTIYFDSKKSFEELLDILTKKYKDEKFVKVLTKADPEIKMVSGTNYCYIKLYKASKEGRFIIVSVLDNLLKGASSQAVQNMNIMLGLEESKGLALSTIYP